MALQRALQLLANGLNAGDIDGDAGGAIGRARIDDIVEGAVAVHDRGERAAIGRLIGRAGADLFAGDGGEQLTPFADGHLR